METKTIATKYKFRSECLSDILLFLGTALDKVRLVSIEIAAADEFLPDCTCTIAARTDLETIREILGIVPDGHVMVETLAYEQDYTGIR